MAADGVFGAAGPWVERGVAHAEYARCLVDRLMPGGRAADRVGDMPADQRRMRQPAGRVGGLGGGRNQALELAVPAQPDDVDQIAGLQSRKPDLYPAEGTLVDGHDPRRASGALVNDERATGSLSDGAGDASDVGPYPVGGAATRRMQSHDGVIAGPDGGGI